MKVEVLGEEICVDGAPLSYELPKAFVIRKGQTFSESVWPDFDPELAGRMLGPSVDAICAEIAQLRKKGLVPEAVAFSDKLFEAFTPPMNWLFEMSMYSGMDPVWEWVLDRTSSWEKANGVEYGKGIHKGTAF